MIYNPLNPLDIENAKLRFSKLLSGKLPFELTGKKPVRSLSQNAYLHLTLSYFASQTGECLDYVKINYYKKLVNSELFIREKNDTYLGRVEYLRSTSELDTDEMSLSIERFRNWSSMEAGIYLPAPDEDGLLQLVGIEVERNKSFV
jgi:hypothetical protein